MLLACWLNGAPVTALPLLERAFAYGDGLFSTIAVANGQASLLELHWQRLAIGCQRLALALDDMSRWQQDFQRFCRQYPDCTAKIIVSRGEGGRGYLADPGMPAHCYFYAYAPTVYPVQHQQGINTGFLRGRLGLNPLLAGLKHLNRLEQVLLRQELATTPFPEALVCDINGYVIEGVFSNVFLVQNGRLITPPLHEAGVAGVRRQQILTLAASLAIPLHEQKVTPEQVLAADEIFFCNSLYGIWPVKQIQGTIRAHHAVTRQLQQQLNYV